MTTSPSIAGTHSSVDPRAARHMEGIGVIASEWNRLELHINYYIWELANVEKHAGACITAQIIPPSAKTRALIALAHLRKAPPPFIAKLNSFAERVDKLARRRNRFIHDPWMIRKSDGLVSRFEISADKKLTFEFKPETIAELNRLISDIHDAIDRSFELRKEAGTVLPPFDRTTFSRSPGIVLHPPQSEPTSSPKSPEGPPEPSEA